MDSEQKHMQMADVAFTQLLSAFGIESVMVHERHALKFKSDDPANLLAALSQVHDKLYRASLTLHITTMPTDDRMAAIKKFRKFTDNYLDISTNLLIEMIEAGESTGVTMGIVK